jgi:hypothetical protein
MGQTQNEVLLFMTESAYGTDPTPTEGSNAILTMGRVTISEEGKRMVDREAVRASLGKLQRVFGGMLVRAEFACEIKGSGAAGTAPELDPLFLACGFDDTVVASTSVTYSKVSSGHTSGTMYFYEGGTVRHIITGARGGLRITGAAGGLATAHFSFVGKYANPTDQSIPSPTYNAQVPRAVVGTAIAVNGVTALTVQNWEWNFGTEVGANDSVSAADGYGEVLIRSRDPVCSMQLETPTVAALALDSLRNAGTRFAWTSGVIGSTAGNRVAVTTPASSTYVMGVSQTAVNNIAGRTIELAVDDAVGQPSIVFT